MHDGTWGRVGCLLAPHRVRVSHLRDVTYLGRLPEVGPQSSQLHRKIKTFSSSCLLALPRFTVNQRSACQPETSRGLTDGQVLTDVTLCLLTAPVRYSMPSETCALGHANNVTSCDRLTHIF